ncbi:Adenylosuccinate synthetase [bioreactor metagenome]|uniref:Adenylosuccinate synthetase n=1 Tax=bioreactor metagenome TaxID=1076179 RepID=A0A645DT32_9ZZZZ
MVQGTTEVALTVLDALGYLDEIPMCIAYQSQEINSDIFPNTVECYKAKPVLKIMKGWKSNIRGIRTFTELPLEAQEYVDEIERQIGYPITIISNGPNREDIIHRLPKIGGRVQ